MRFSDYTLLIVESPIIGRELQKLVPQNVLVIATKGYLWYPHFNSDKLTLGRRAIPEKLDIRKLIREESLKAVKIIIAADNDPPGDFIAWSISEDIQNRLLHRGSIQALSKTSAEDLISTEKIIDQSCLYKRLQNRYIIRQLWSQYFPETDMRLAAIAAIFGASAPFTHFKTAQGVIFNSHSPVTCRYGSPLENITCYDEVVYDKKQPLSTYSLIEKITLASDYHSFDEAQSALYSLFETTNPQTGNGLITYPRTDSESFYRENWDRLRQQWIQKASQSEFKPLQLQNVTDPANAHDSIRPIDINVDPSYIQKHIPSALGSIYSLIHLHTHEAISMPHIVKSAYTSNQYNKIFTSNETLKNKTLQLMPFLTISDFGHLLNQLGVERPSGFGSLLDKAKNQGFIKITPTFEIEPGNKLSDLIPEANRYQSLLNLLKISADDPKMNAETIIEILTS